MPEADQKKWRTSPRGNRFRGKENRRRRDSEGEIGTCAPRKGKKFDSSEGGMWYGGENETKPLATQHHVRTIFRRRKSEGRKRRRLLGGPEVVMKVKDGGAELILPGKSPRHIGPGNLESDAAL